MPPSTPRHALSVRFHLANYLLTVVIVLTVWLPGALTAGVWYFWPVWLILGAGIVVVHAIPDQNRRRGSRGRPRRRNATPLTVRTVHVNCRKT